MPRHTIWLTPLLFLVACGGNTPEPNGQVSISAARQQMAASPITLPYRRNDYVIVASGSGNLVRLASDPDDRGVFVPANATIRFSDTSVMSNTETGNLGIAYRLYRATFARTPDSAGLQYWVDVMNGGESEDSIAGAFAGSVEFQGMYGADPKNPSIIASFYRHVLGRDPDPAGLDYWQGVQRRGDVPLAQILLAFSESSENKDAIRPVLARGVAFKEADVAYSGASAPPATLALSASGKRYTGSPLTLRPDGTIALSPAATYTWSLIDKPFASKMGVAAATPQLAFVPDVPGTYVIGLVAVDGGKRFSGSLQFTVTPERLPNKPYVARNGMTVTLESVEIVDHGTGYVDYLVTYSQANTTTKPIEEGILKLYFEKAEPLAQTGFFNKLYPGETSRRSYRFTQEKSTIPAVLEYDQDNTFRTAPWPDSLQWPVPID